MDNPAHAVIRPAQAGDAESIALLATQLGYSAAPGAIPDRLARVGAAPAGTALVAETGGHVAGIITAHLIPSIHDDAPVAWITTLVVLEDVRGRGIGRQLVAAAEAWARANGAMRLVVSSRAHRLDAHRFYESLGYEKTGVRFAKKFTLP